MSSEQDTELEERKYWHDNGQIWTREFYRNGKQEGERKVWYKNGQLLAQGFYRNGKLEGELKFWGKSGRLWEQQLYRNGKLIDSSFTRNKKKAFIRIKNNFQDCSIYQVDQMLISDLIKMIN